MHPVEKSATPLALQRRASGDTASKLILLLSLTVFMGWGSSVKAENIGWIADSLTVPLRSGPSNGHRIVNRGLPSGTRLTILGVDQEAGFSHIVTNRGTEGWLPSQYIVHEPIARDQLQVAQKRIAELQEAFARQGKLLSDISSENRVQGRKNNSLMRQIESLQRDLTEIKGVSAGAIKEHERNGRLESLNQKLRAAVEDLTLAKQRAQKNASQNWMLLGGGLVFGGLLLGVFIKSRPRRSGWS